MTAVLDRQFWTRALVFVVALTALRLTVIFTSNLTLGSEEAQYWSWSLNPDLGYFSKPPLIAWLIAAMTSVCGDGEGCIRAASPLLYAIAALFIFEAARVLYGARAGFWSAIVFVTLPGVSLSSGLMTTDVPLLAFWSAALFLLALLLRRAPGDARGIALALGAVIGLATLSKYAGAYFLVGLLAASFVDARLRAQIWGRNGVLILVAAVGVVSPNIWWNVEHGFATLQSTAGNAVISDTPFNLDRVIEFIATQMGLIGPILFGTLMCGLVRSRREGRWPQATSDDRVLVIVSLPALLVGTAIALLSKANGNWGGTAMPGLAIVATVWLLRAGTLKWLTASLAFATFIGVTVFALALSPAFVDAIGLSRGLKVLRGWNTHGPQIVRAARENGIDTLLSDDREEMAMMLYYTRGSGLAVFMWTPQLDHPVDHYQMTRAYRGLPDRVLYVTKRPDPSDVTTHFAAARESEISSVTVGPGRKRTFKLIDMSGFRGE